MADTLFPQKIPPQQQAFGVADKNGKVTIDKNWWLFLYNIALQVLQSNAGVDAQTLAEFDVSESETPGDSALSQIKDLQTLLWGDDEGVYATLSSVYAAQASANDALLLGFLADVDTL